jgi:RsiW-degrading membrane proteinase PrsW (M82 family)
MISMILLPLLLGILPGFAWLIFYLEEDPHAEPERLIIFTFLTGIAFGFFTIIIEHFFTEFAGSLGITEFSIISLLVLAAIEETVKFASAYLSISQTPEAKDPIDPMIYMIVAALGFATLENIGTLANIPTNGFLPSALQTLLFRFVGATLLHTLTSGIIGYYWSVGASRNKAGWYIARATILAALIHATFNYLILNYENLAYAGLFIIIVGFLVLNDFEKLEDQYNPPNTTS